MIEQAKEIIKRATNIVGLTGAGISTPSGIPDFRSPESGMWDRVDPFKVASIQGFQQNPQAFYDWVMPLVEQTRQAQPNAAHFALAQMESHGALKAVITQNIDMLHTKAGSQTVYEVHGHMRSAHCLTCKTLVDGETVLTTVVETKAVPLCHQCGEAVKPDVILFGELLPFQILHDAQAAVESCDVLIVVGSSLEVAPVNEMPLMAKRNGAKLIIVNFEPTYLDRLADCVIHEDVVDVLPQFANVILSK